MPSPKSKTAKPAEPRSRDADRSQQAILLAARSFQASDLFAGIVLLGALGFASNVLLALAERRLLRWQRP